MKHGEIACVVGRVIGVNLRCGSITGYQRGMFHASLVSISVQEELWLVPVAANCHLPMADF
jgi:hypothetical protein